MINEIPQACRAGNSSDALKRFIEDHGPSLSSGTALWVLSMASRPAVTGYRAVSAGSCLFIRGEMGVSGSGFFSVGIIRIHFWIIEPRGRDAGSLPSKWLSTRRSTEHREWKNLPWMDWLSPMSCGCLDMPKDYLSQLQGLQVRQPASSCHN